MQAERGARGGRGRRGGRERPGGDRESAGTAAALARGGCGDGGGRRGRGRGFRGGRGGGAPRGGRRESGGRGRGGGGGASTRVSGAGCCGRQSAYGACAGRSRGTRVDGARAAPGCLRPKDWATSLPVLLSPGSQSLMVSLQLPATGRARVHEPKLIHLEICLFLYPVFSLSHPSIA